MKFNVNSGAVPHSKFSENMYSTMVINDNLAGKLICVTETKIDFSNTTIESITKNRFDTVVGQETKKIAYNMDVYGYQIEKNIQKDLIKLAKEIHILQVNTYGNKIYTKK